MPAYLRFPAAELPKAVGADAADGRRVTDGRAGHICHGPYITLGPGRYTGGFYLRRASGEAKGEIRIDACADHARRTFARRAMPVKDLFASVDGFVHLDFSVDAVERGCELRLHVSAQALIEVTQAVLFRRDLSLWGHR